MKRNYLNTMLSNNRDYRKSFILAVVLPVVVLIGAITVKLNSEFFAHSFPPCTLKALTGINCLSCGATRSTLALLHGNLGAAIYYNPLYIVFLGWLVYLYLRLIISLIRSPYQKYSIKLSVPIGIAIAVIVTAFFVIRNTNFYQAVFY